MREQNQHHPSWTDQSTTFKSLANVASLINASSHLDATLDHLLQAICGETPWAAGGLMYVDTENGYAEVIARHDPSRVGASMNDRWSLAESPSQIALTTNEPVIIEDARQSTQFPGYRREAIEHGYATVVVLPMAYRSPEGHRTVLSVRSREVVAVTPADIAFLQFVVRLGEIAMNKARSLAEEQAFGRRLHDALAAHGALLDQILANGSLEQAGRQVASMLPNPLAIVDLTSQRVLAEHSPMPGLIGDPLWQTALDGEDGQALLDLARRSPSFSRPDARELTLSIAGHDIRVSAIICPLNVDGERVGALIIFSGNADFNDLDYLLLDSARFGLGVQMMRAHVAAAAEARGVEELLTELLDGSRRHPREIAAQARRLGIDLAAPARLLMFSMPDGEISVEARGQELRRIFAHAVKRFDERATLMLRAEGLVVRHLADPRRTTDLHALMQRLAAEISAATNEAPVIMHSDPCRGAADYAAAWREFGRICGLARRFNRRGLVAARDFGPFPVLMSAVETGEMNAFVENLIGAAARNDVAHGTAYIETLSAFLDSGCRSQPCADALGLHVTTLRYRLARLKDLFAIRTETPEQRFALQLALQFRKLMLPGGSILSSPESEKE